VIAPIAPTAAVPTGLGPFLPGTRLPSLDT
jgi:hypothetical protein